MAVISPRRGVTGRSADLRNRRVVQFWPALILAFVLGAAAAYRQGLIPARFSPLPALDLAEPEPWLRDWRLAELRHEPELCRRVLTPPVIAAQSIADEPLKAGCGWQTAVRVTAVAGARLSLDKLTCEMAAAVAHWMQHDVQPLALAHFGERVATVQHLGGYACRNIAGAALWRGVRSEHARANAVDVTGVTLVSGRQISVLKGWQGGGSDAAFLKAIHARACATFQVVLGPDHNESHRDHFHLDRGLFSRCR